MGAFPLKTAITIGLFAGLAALPEFVPQLANYKLVSWDRFGAVLEFRAKRTPLVVVEETDSLRPQQALVHQAVFPLDDPLGNLEGFYAALRRTEMKEGRAITRILHYGDSPTTADLITADLRAGLQERFGDAGHGFVLPAKPWAWYGHRGVELSGNGWQASPANQSDVHDGFFGLGGVSFRGGTGATAELRLAPPGHTVMDISYLEEKSGGKFEVLSDGQRIGAADTSASASKPAFLRLAISPSARKFHIRVLSGSVRLYGVEFSKTGPGLIYSSLGLNGAYTAVLSKMFNEEHWAQQLQHYKPDLVIINYGTNESVYAAFVDKSYQREIRESVRRIRAAYPGVSILIMSPMDRGERDSTGEITTVPALARLITLQQRSAQEMGCAFFNTYEAMGGSGTMSRWYSAEPRLVSADFIHPTPTGARMVGNLLYRALLNGYYRYKVKMMRGKLASVLVKEAAHAN